MNFQHTANPRLAALLVLIRIAKAGDYADRLMDQALTHGKLVGPDRGLFAELVFGVLRRQGTLDHYLSALLDKPLEKLDLQVKILLRLGLYQLACLERIPESAAVNESVKLAKEILPRAAGLVNAVLRNFLRRRGHIPLPDPAADPAAAIAARHSHPKWLVQDWLAQLGAEAEQLAEASSRQPLMTLRVNTLRAGREQVLEKLATDGVSAEPCRYAPDGIRLEGRQHLGLLPGFAEGLFTVQDEASQLAARLLEPQPGERVLDCCAAPGGKATYLAQLMDNCGSVMATDISRSKLSLIRDAATRLGIGIITADTIDMLKPELLPAGPFDRILLDAPCSGIGVIRRNPETKWRLTPQDIARLSAAQKLMLRHAAALLKPGGSLVYSTCSTMVEENEAVVADFLSGNTDYVVEDLLKMFPPYGDLITGEGYFRSWPHRHDMDGFFAARLRKV